MTNNQMVVTLTSNGRTMVLGPGGDYDITEITGLESSALILNTSKKVGLYGSKVNGKSIDERSIHIVASSKASSDSNPALRAKTIKFFNPNYTGNMLVNNMGTERTIDYEIEGWKFSKQDNLDCPLEIVVDLLCPEALFRNTSDFGKNMAYIAPQFAFPWRTLAVSDGSISGDYAKMGHAGQITGYRQMNASTAIKNDGDVPTGFKVRFVANGGEVENPFIQDATTEKIVQVDITLSDGDILIVDTIEGEESITLNGENCYQYIDRQSELFGLQVGTNHFKYGAESGRAFLDAYLYYTPRYLGV